MHYYKRNIGDYHKKAGRLTMLQHGAYTLLMDSCYDREEFPTLDLAIDWLWASTDAEVDAVKFVLNKFFTLESDVYTQNRIKEDLGKYHANSKTNKRIAMEREAKRKEKSTKRVPSVDESNTVEHEATPNHKPLTTNQEPLTTNQKPLKDLSASPPVRREIFNYWKSVMNKDNSSRLNKKRESAIKARMKEGYSALDIKQAIDGCSNTPHNMGQNENGELYNDLELICRNGSNLERFMGNVNRISAPNQQNKGPGLLGSAPEIPQQPVVINQTGFLEHDA